MLSKYFLMILLFLSLVACAATSPTSLHPSLENPDLWRYGHDPYGSSVIIGESLIQDGAVRIAFKRAALTAPDKNTWVELIYDAPAGNLANVNVVRISYQSSVELLMKFSQRDYGEDGDNSYAHYQTRLPAAKSWNIVEVKLHDFSRPGWTPAYSVDKGLIMENVAAIYLAPALDDLRGGAATLNVNAIDLIYQ